MLSSILWLTIFTFQSGYIQIVALERLKAINYNFTFQSGYIQMCHFQDISLQDSNFTFQSGYIQIVLP